MSVKKEYKNELLAIILKYVPSCTVYFFGSRAKNQEKIGSDIDLAIASNDPILDDKITKILIDIDETTIPAKVDIINLQTAHQNIKTEILKNGILWTS